MHLSQEFFMLATLFIATFWLGVWAGSKEHKQEVKWFQQLLYEGTMNFYLNEEGWEFDQAEAKAREEIDRLVREMHKELNGGV